MKVFSAFQDERTYQTLKAPVKVYYDVAFACNLKCSFCYVNWKGLAAATELGNPSIEHVERILQKLKEAEVFDIVTLGGDLFSYPRYRDFIRLASTMGFGVGVISNATQVTPQIAQELAPYVNSCAVSFRGPEAAVFDAVTQVSGAFDNTINGLRALADAKITISLLYDPLPENYQGLFETVRLLIEDYKLPIAALQVNRMTPEGRGLDNWDHISLPQEAYYALFDQMLHIKEIFRIRASVGDAFPFCQVPSQYWSLLERCEYGVLWGAVTSRGEVKKCSVGAVSLGNILKRPLSKIWQHSNLLTSYRSFQWTSEECRQCPLLVHCAGGCSISTPGEKLDTPDYWQPKSVTPREADMYKAFLESSNNSHDESQCQEWNEEDYPLLMVRPRYRQENIGTLCVPHSTTVVIEQSEIPWLVIDETEQKIMELCDGSHKVTDISQTLRHLAPRQVLATLKDLTQAGYLAKSLPE